MPRSNSPVLRDVTDRFGQVSGVDFTPTHEALNLAMAISLVGSTGGVSLLLLYARQMLPPSVVSRPLAGVAPTIELVLGFVATRASPLLLRLVEGLVAREPESGGDRQAAHAMRYAPPAS